MEWELVIPIHGVDKERWFRSIVCSVALWDKLWTVYCGF